MMHDLLRWEYHAKLWMVDHPLVFLIQVFAMIAIIVWINR